MTERNTGSAVQAADGLLKKIQSNLWEMTLKIEVLTTPDCSSCSRLESMLDEIGVHYETIDVTQKPEYLERYPIFTAPGLVINDKLVFTGIPKKEELESMIKS